MEIDYDFIKSEEAKEIYLKLEKRRMFKEYSGWDDPHLDAYFLGVRAVLFELFEKGEARKIADAASQDELVDYIL